METTPGTPTTALVFLNNEYASHPPPAEPPSYLSQVLTPSGTVIQDRGNSSFNDGTSALSGYVFQIAGAPVGSGSVGVFDAINLETLASTPLHTPAGGSYTLPLGARPVAALSNLIGAGAYAGQGLAYDLSTNLIVPIVIANTSVALF